MTGQELWSSYRRRAVVAVVLDLPDEDPQTICEHIAMTPYEVGQILRAAGHGDVAVPFLTMPRGNRTRHVVAEEVEHLTGESIPTICRTLGRTPSAVARSLHRAGRHDLAVPFDRDVWAQRRQAATRTRPDTRRAVTGAMADLTPRRNP